MPKIICEGCQVQFKTDSIGIAVIETFNRPAEFEVLEWTENSRYEQA